MWKDGSECSFSTIPARASRPIFEKGFVLFYFICFLRLSFLCSGIFLAGLFFSQRFPAFACNGVWIWSWRSCGLFVHFFFRVKGRRVIKKNYLRLFGRKPQIPRGKTIFYQTITSYAQYPVKYFTLLTIDSLVRCLCAFLMITDLSQWIWYTLCAFSFSSLGNP